jgi:hypothetical protein
VSSCNALLWFFMARCVLRDRRDALHEGGARVVARLSVPKD